MKSIFSTLCFIMLTVFTIHAQNIFTNEAGTYAGIGLTSPKTALHIRKDVTSLSAANFITIDNRGSNAQYSTSHVIGGILFSGFRDIRYPANVAGIWAVRTPAASGLSSQEDIVFGTTNGPQNLSQDNALPIEQMRINYAGNVGIGTANPGNKLQIADGADDNTPYGSIQIIRAANPADNRFHLSFVRNGNMVSGIGYVGTTNTLGIWTGTNTAPTPVIAFTQGQYVGIGTSNPQSLLAVKGTITARKVVVTQSGWADYVFDSSYDLKPLSDVEQFVNKRKLRN